MDSSHNILTSSSQIPQKDQYDTFNQPRKYPSLISSRRTPSFSSLSSSSCSSSYNPSDLDSPLSPATPLGTFTGVPFSWEHFPGIPKKQQLSKKILEESSSIKLLPLPPTTNNKKKMFSLGDINGVIKIKKAKSVTTSFNHNKHQESYDSESDIDPFLAALIACSKEDDDDIGASAKVSRSLSDRFGFISLYASCKRTCAVAESIRHLPKSSASRSSSYDLIKYQSR